MSIKVLLIAYSGTHALHMRCDLDLVCLAITTRTQLTYVSPESFGATDHNRNRPCYGFYQNRLVGKEVRVNAAANLTRTKFGGLGVSLHRMQF
jgi:hypothetical protein